MGVNRHRLGMVERADIDPNHVWIGISRGREILIKQQAATVGTETFVLNGRRPVELRLALGESERGSRSPTATMNALPVDFWHIRQWQIVVLIGGSLDS